MASEAPDDYHGVHNDMLAWLFSTANAVIEADRLPVGPYTGPISGSYDELITLSTLIAGTEQPLPRATLGQGLSLFSADMDGRTLANQWWTARAEKTEDPVARREIEDGNRTHKDYIDQLFLSYNVLGACRLEDNSSPWEDELGDQPKGVSANPFEVLPLEDCNQEEPQPSLPQPEESVEPGKPAPAKKAKKSKKKRPQRKTQKPRRKAQQPEDSRVKDPFCTLVSNLSRVWSTARALLQQEWLKFARGESNSAAIAAWCDTAIELVEH